MKRLAVVGFVTVLTLAAGTARGAEQPPGLLFGIVGDRVLAQGLVRFDPSTLRPLAGRIPLAGHRSGWSFSPDRDQLVLGRSRERCGRTTLRFVDTRALRTAGDVQIAANGPVMGTAWLGSSRVAAVVGPSVCLGIAQTRVVTVDAATRQVLTTSWLRGTVLSLGRAPGRLVLLLAPTGKIGMATVAVVDADGTVRQKSLEAIPAGWKLPAGTGTRDVTQPGLAIDPAAGRAFVVPGRDTVAEIDLRTLRVGIYELSERALAKGMGNGSVRSALWLGNGRLAVTGTDLVDRTVDGHPDVGTTPAGLRIIDTRTWTFRTLDPQVSNVTLAGSTLLAHGSSSHYDGSRTTTTNTGLVAFSSAGRELYRLFQGLPVGQAAAIDGRGYATVGGTTYRNRTIEFDLASGTVRRSLDRPLWELLLGRAAF